jgi:hypothetical protein
VSRVLRVLLSPRWLLRHVLLAAAIAVCWGFGTWQLGRAQDRHSFLNWSYTVEWGLFGAFAVLCWGWFLRDELSSGPGMTKELVPARQSYFPVPLPITEEEDPELAAYNQMLQQLNRKERT